MELFNAPSSSTFRDPSDISNLAVWYDMSSWWPAHVDADDADAIRGRWHDKSTSGRIFPGVGGSEPNATPDGNIRTTLDFDGAANYLLDPSLVIAQPFTVFMVIKQATYGAGDEIWMGAASANDPAIEQAVGSGTLRMRAGGTNGATASLALSTQGIVTAVFNGASSSLQVNDGTISTATVGSTGITAGHYVGGGFSTFYDGTMSEFGIYNAAISTSDRASLVSHLKTKYGI